MCSTNTQIRLRISTVWSESSLSAWKKLWIFGYQTAPSEDSDQTARMRRLIWIFVGHTCQKGRFLILRLICKLLVFDCFYTPVQVVSRQPCVKLAVALFSHKILCYNIDQYDLRWKVHTKDANIFFLKAIYNTENKISCMYNCIKKKTLSRSTWLARAWLLVWLRNVIRRCSSQTVYSNRENN